MKYTIQITTANNEPYEFKVYDYILTKEERKAIQRKDDKISTILIETENLDINIYIGTEFIINPSEAIKEWEIIGRGIQEMRKHNH